MRGVRRYGGVARQSRFFCNQTDGKDMRMIKIKLTKNKCMRYCLAESAIAEKELWHRFRSRPLDADGSSVYFLNALSLDDDERVKNILEISKSDKYISCCLCALKSDIVTDDKELQKIINDITNNLRSIGGLEFAVTFCIGSYDLLVLFASEDEEKSKEYARKIKERISDKCAVIYALSDIEIPGYGDTIDENVKNSVDRFCEIYEKLAKSEHRAHRRLISAVREIEGLYNKAVAAMNGMAVSNAIGTFIVSFLDSESELIDYMLQRRDTSIRDGQNQKLDEHDFTAYFEMYTEHFRDTLSPLLNELVHAQPHNFNDYTASLCSIESSVKLLWIYNELLHEWNELALKSNDLSDIDKNAITFAVVSGKADITVNEDPFNYNHDVFNKNGEKNISRPILVKMPEAGLYDIEGSVFRLAHEFFHLRGARKRGERTACYLNSLCYIFGLYCFDNICNRVRRTRARSIFESKIYNCELRLYYPRPESFNEFVEDILSVHKNGQIKSVVRHRQASAEQYHSSRGTSTKALDGLTDTLSAKLEDAHKNIYDNFIDMSALSGSRRTFAREIGEFLQVLINDAVKSQYGDTLEKVIVRNNLSRDQAFNFCIRALEEQLKDEKKKIEHDESGNLLEKSMSVKFDDKPIAEKIKEEANRAAQCGEGLFSWYDLSLADAHMRSHLQRILATCATDFINENHRYKQLIYNILPGLYKECIADCLALKMMNCDNRKINFVNYILYFLYEKRSISDFFKDANSSERLFKTIRLCAVKDTCGLEYEKTKRKEYVDQIRKYYKDVMYPHGSDDKEMADYANDLLNNLDAILDKYDEYKEYIYVIQLTDYLRKCVEANEQLLKDMSNCIKKLNIGNDGAHETGYMDFITEKWCALLKRKRR